MFLRNVRKKGRNMTEVNELGPEEWSLELHHMANAGFDDLRHVILAVDRDAQVAADFRTMIVQAFSLVTEGMGLQPDDLVANQAEFLKAAESSDPQKRFDLMHLALAKLSKTVGFSIEM